jgi:hypothetical protein
MIANGKKVAWTYQAGGIEFSQEGKIIAMVPAGESANMSLAHIDSSATSRQKKFSDTSSNDRYLIAVKNEHGIMNYYAPTVGVVDKQNPKAVKAFEKSTPTVAMDTTETTSIEPIQTMKQVKEGVKAGRTPALNSEFTMGNTTMYRILGKDGKGGFVGYRLYSGTRVLKFLVSEGGQPWTYHSAVRDAYSGYARAADSDGNMIQTSLSVPEVIKFVDSIEKQLKSMGFTKVTTDMLLSEMQKAVEKSDTRRAITAVFQKNKY